MTSSVNSSAPQSALTKMGNSPVNALQKYNIDVSEQNKSFAYQPQVRPSSYSDLSVPKQLQKGSALNIKV